MTRTLEIKMLDTRIRLNLKDKDCYSYMSDIFQKYLSGEKDKDVDIG